MSRCQIKQVILKYKYDTNRLKSLFTPQREATHRVANTPGCSATPTGSPEPSELRFREAALARHGTIHHGIAHVTTETSEDFQNRKKNHGFLQFPNLQVFICVKNANKTPEEAEPRPWQE